MRGTAIRSLIPPTLLDSADVPIADLLGTASTHLVTIDDLVPLDPTVDSPTR
jgi:hypothetical protein